MPTYWSEVEFLFREGSPEKVALTGGMTFVFMVADDARHALQRIDRAFADQNLDVLNVEFVAPYAGDSFETPDQEHHYLSLAERAERTSEVIFDDADVYEEDE